MAPSMPLLQRQKIFFKGRLSFTHGIGKKGFMYGKNADANVTYATLTCVKYITVFVKITIFTQVNE